MGVASFTVQCGCGLLHSAVWVWPPSQCSLGVASFTERSVGVASFTERSVGVFSFTENSVGVGSAAAAQIDGSLCGKQTINQPVIMGEHNPAVTPQGPFMCLRGAGMIKEKSLKGNLQALDRYCALMRSEL